MTPSPDPLPDKLSELTDEQIQNSPAIKRLIEEVRVDKEQPLHGYNRTYHRHNR